MLVLPLITIAVPVLFGVGFGEPAVGGGLADSRAAPLCGIEASSHGAMIGLRAVFTSGVDVEATYRFKVVSDGPGGHSEVSQGGPFTAAAGQTVTVGQVSVNASTTHAIDFKVAVAGTELDCSGWLPSRS